MKWFSIYFYNYKFDIYDNTNGLLMMTYDDEEIKENLKCSAMRNFTIRELIAFKARNFKRIIEEPNFLEILLEFYRILQEDYGDIFAKNVKIICVSEPKIGKVDFRDGIQ